jgi:putative ABC transport system permease protein
VFRERASTFGASEIQRESVVVPFRLLRTFTGTELIKVLYVQAASAESVDGVTSALRQLLERRHRPGARYRVENLSGILDAARRISTALSVTLVVIALVALGVSGVGIMNVMLVTVAERAHEIGLRKAVGAPRRTILAQFLIEAGVISGTGAIAGVVLAVVLLIPARWFLPPELSVQVSPWAVLLALGVSASVGIVFGYLPAERAASLQPVDALRHE